MSCWDRDCLRRANLFPETKTHDSDEHVKHGMTMTIAFSICLVGLVAALTVYYALQESTVTVVIENPSSGETDKLFLQDTNLRCGCENVLIDNRQLGTMTFGFDTLCTEIKGVWSSIKDKAVRRWEVRTFKSIIKGTYHLCSVAEGTINRAYYTWLGNSQVSTILHDRGNLAKVLVSQAAVLSNQAKTALRLSLEMGTLSDELKGPATYFGDTQVTPVSFQEAWALHPHVSSLPNFTLFSLSKMATRYQNESLNFREECSVRNIRPRGEATDKDLACYFDDWSRIACQDDFDVLAYLVKNGQIRQGLELSGLKFNLTYYCSPYQTLYHFPTAALASEAFWNWTGLADNSFGRKMSQSSYSTILEAVDGGFLSNSKGCGCATTSNYTSYFESCLPHKCQYTTTQQTDISTIVVIMFGLIGGLVSALQIVVPVLFSPCKPKKSKDLSEVPSKTQYANNDPKTMIMLDDMTIDKTMIVDNKDYDNDNTTIANATQQGTGGGLTVYAKMRKEMESNRREIEILKTLLGVKPPSAEKEDYALQKPYNKKGVKVFVDDNNCVLKYKRRDEGGDPATISSPNLPSAGSPAAPEKKKTHARKKSKSMSNLFKMKEWKHHDHDHDPHSSHPSKHAQKPSQMYAHLWRNNMSVIRSMATSADTTQRPTHMPDHNDVKEDTFSVLTPEGGGVEGLRDISPRSRSTMGRNLITPRNDELSRSTRSLNPADTDTVTPQSINRTLHGLNETLEGLNRTLETNRTGHGKGGTTRI
uniref:Uncharacterized protein n=1 Tax=Lotharella globosa TaxID=91324 RepID=A0A7S3YUB9_9EUKA|mmetsp:Transcript_13987/g.28295  ORF Transcript_13987/g.28295 Transcript_13987/m.28295 type:complete len:760 (+) Transcript_13987:120-2399(+)